MEYLLVLKIEKWFHVLKLGNSNSIYKVIFIFTSHVAHLSCTGNRICILHEVTRAARACVYFCMNLMSFVRCYDLFNHWHTLYCLRYCLRFYSYFCIIQIISIFIISYFITIHYFNSFLYPSIYRHRGSISKGSAFINEEEKNRWRIHGSRTLLSASTYDRHMQAILSFLKWVRRNSTTSGQQHRDTDVSFVIHKQFPLDVGKMSPSTRCQTIAFNSASLCVSPPSQSPCGKDFLVDPFVFLFPSLRIFLINEFGSMVIKSPPQKLSNLKNDINKYIVYFIFLNVYNYLQYYLVIFRK